LDRQFFRRGTLSAIRPESEWFLSRPEPLVVNEMRVIFSDGMPGALFGLVGGLVQPAVVADDVAGTGCLARYPGALSAIWQNSEIVIRREKSRVTPHGPRSRDRLFSSP
jgi:hypothetical protein